MAKRKVKRSNAKNEVVVPEVVAVSNISAAGKPNKFLIILLSVFVLFTISEIYFVSMNSIRQSKKPVYIASWPVMYKGYTSAEECGDFLYVSDATRGDVYITNKTNGSIEKQLTFPEGTDNAVADSTGNIYVLTKTNEVIEVDGKTYKTIMKIKPDGITNATWLDVDSKDNFFIVNGSSNNIIKYDHNFKKILQFGGQSADKGSLNGVGKIFVGPSDKIYVTNTYSPGKLEVKIFDDNGKFINSWHINKMKSFDSLTSLAITSKGNVYINCYKESKIYVFASDGKFLGSFDSDKDGRFQIVNGAVLIAGGRNGIIYVFSSQIGELKTIQY